MSTKDEDEQKEQVKSWAGKNSLERHVQAGLHGPPQLKKEERRQFLGQFRERILKALTFAQVAEKGTYPEIRAALQDIRAERLVISRRADLSAAGEYIRLARKNGLSFTTVDSPRYEGDIGLVVASGTAVDEENILVPSRRERLLAKGLPPELIDAAEEKICPSCLRLLREIAPEELPNYRPLTFLDRILNRPCSSCS